MTGPPLTLPEVVVIVLFMVALWLLLGAQGEDS
jgi:hypothetical protein